MELRNQALTRESKSGVLKQFFPSLATIPNYVEPDFVETQFFTGHGVFATNLKRFQLASHDTCKCDQVSRQTVNHVLLHCPRFDQVREQEQIEAGQPYHASKLDELISTRRRYRNFISMIRRIHEELKLEHNPA